jgi:hypothetical protein
MESSFLPFGPGCPWYEWFEKFGPPNVDWCEATVCGFMNEPANAWSNLAYLIGAVYLFRLGMRRYGISIFLMGLGSLLYHATNNFMTQLFDFLGMFIWALLILNWNFQRLQWVSARWRVVSYLSLNVVTMAALFLMRSVGIPYQSLMPLIGLGVLVTEVMLSRRDEGVKKNYAPLFWMLSFLGIAAVFSASDLRRIWCDPDNHLVQGHALWHLFGAIGITLSGHFYRQIPLCRS